MRKALFILSLLLIYFLSTGQETPVICGTGVPDSAWEALFSRKVKEYKRIKEANRTDFTYTIPVIVHVLHNGDPVNTGENNSTENISWSQVNSQIAVLNEDFSGSNEDITRTPEVWQNNLAGDLGIQFCLAKVDTNGNALAEEGINRIDWEVLGWNNFDSLSKTALRNFFDNTVMPETRWDPTRYVNIWVYGSKNRGSWALFPVGIDDWGAGENNVEDEAKSGIVIWFKNFGTEGTVNYLNNPFNKGRIATHEVGHWLGLRHISGDAVCNSLNLNWIVNDHCSDTPKQKGGHPVNDTIPAPQDIIDNGLNVGCPTFPWQPDICWGPGDNDYGEMFMNYMDYTNDTCRYMFTEDQADRMHTAMMAGMYRAPLQYSTACESPCADLRIKDQTISPNYCLAGDSVTLSFKEENLGAALSDTNYVSFHLSPNNILTPGQNGDVYISEYHVEQELDPQEQTSQLGLNVLIPGTMNPGTYYLFFSADGAQEIEECDEENNFATRIITVSDSIIASDRAYRYWFDDQFDQAVSVTHALGDTFQLIDSIPTTTLSNGLHTFHIAFKDTSNRWSSTLSSLFVKLSSAYPSGTPRYEYWYDQNYSSRIVKSVTSTSNLMLVRDLSTGSLNPGLHTFTIRLKPDGRHWSSPISSLFYKLGHPPPAGQAQHEYWFDDDYAGRTIQMISPIDNLVLLDSLLTDSLSIGLHTFHGRYKPDGGHWSSVTSDLFYKVRETGGDLIKYQYWFDDNVEDSITVDIPATDNILLNEQIESPDIPRGLHSFHIRHLQSDGLWSSVTSDLFYKNDPHVPNNRIVRFVYWYDGNWQNSQTLFLPGLPNDSLTIYINAEDLSLGEHTVSMFFRDVGEKWSSIISDTFSKVDPAIVCPFNDKTFTAGIGVPEGALFQWQVNTGSGFEDISDDLVYSGSTSDSLILTDAPTSWYGNQYRCQITDEYGTVQSQTYTLRFSLTWDGSDNTAWEDPDNWSCDAIPDAYTDVYVNTGLVNYPEVSSEATCRKLDLKPGAVVVVNPGFELGVTGNE